MDKQPIVDFIEVPLVQGQAIEEGNLLGDRAGVDRLLEIHQGSQGNPDQRNAHGVAAHHQKLGEVKGVFRVLGGVGRLQEMLKQVVPGHTQQPNQHRGNRQHHQRQHHRGGRLMRLVGVVMVVVVAQFLGIHRAGAEVRGHFHRHGHSGRRQQLLLDRLVIAPEFAFKGVEVHPEHIERGHTSRHPGDRPESGVSLEGQTQNFILRPEPGKGRNSANGQRSNKERARRDRHIFPQAAHQAHILRQHGVVAHHRFHAVDHGAGTEEQHCLEVGVGH